MLIGRSKRKLKQEFERDVLPMVDRLYGFAVYLCGNREEAQDLVQDTLVKAFRSFARFTPGTNLKAWLYTIMTNTHKNNRRRRSNHWIELDESLLHGDEEIAWSKAPESPEVVAIRKTVGDTVRQGIERLPPDFRAVVLLADFEGYSYREISDILGCPMGTVMSRLHRGRRALKAALGDDAKLDLVAADEEGGRHGL